MKEIMADRGEVDDDGVPRLEYVPKSSQRQLELFSERPIVALSNGLLETFAGRTLTVKAIFEQHNVGTRFIARNYRKVLLDLEEHGSISCDPDRDSRRKGTMADRVSVSFPS